MANIISYLNWRGDLSFSERAFCEVDNLVLAALAYIDFKGIVPGDSDVDAWMTLAEAAAQVQAQGKGSISLVQQPKEFLTAAAASKRYRNVRLSRHVDVLDEETETEFCALHMELGDGSVYVAFRGTGDMLLGWREDFSMAFQLMPAQRAAAAYLERTIDGDGDVVYRVGGHSKGGNLAVYAAMMCSPEKQARIIQIYSNDGPGFCEELIDMERYAPIRERIVRIVPEFSVIGMLFENDPPTKRVASTAEGLAQHDNFSWQVEGDHFVEAETEPEKCRFYNEMIREWIASADMEQRRAFVRDLFGAMEKLGKKKATELGSGGMDEFETILLSLLRSESQTKVAMKKFVQSFVGTFRSVHFQELIRERRMLQSIGYFVVGVFLAALPGFAAQCIGFGVGGLALWRLTRKQLECAFQEYRDPKEKRIRLLVQLGLMWAVVFLVAQRSLRIHFSNLMLGGFFLFHAYRWIRAATAPGANPRMQGVNMVFGLVAFLMGMVPVIMSGILLENYVFAAGVAILLYAAGKILRAMYDNGQKNGKV